MVNTVGTQGPYLGPNGATAATQSETTKPRSGGSNPDAAPKTASDTVSLSAAARAVRNGSSARVGARMAVFSGGEKQVREVMAGSSFLGGQDPRVHFGLGTWSRVDSLKIRWPSGAIDRHYNLEADLLIVLVEGGKIRDF